MFLETVESRLTHASNFFKQKLEAFRSMTEKAFKIISLSEKFILKMISWPRGKQY